MPEKLYGTDAVGKFLGAANSTVCKWRTRYIDTPEPTHEVGEIPLWNLDGLTRWKAWHDLHNGRKNG